MLTASCDRCGTQADATSFKNRRPLGWSTLRLDTTGPNLKGRDAIIADLLCPACTKTIRDVLDDDREARTHADH